MTLTLFRRQLILTALIMTTFIVLGLIAAFVVGTFEDSRMRASPFVPLARLIDTVAANEKLALPAALEEVVKQSHLDDDRLSFAIVSAAELEAGGLFKGKTLPTQAYDRLFLDKPLFGPPAGEVIRLQDTNDTYLFVRFTRRENSPSGTGFFGRPPPPPDGFGMGGPRPPSKAFFDRSQDGRPDRPAGPGGTFPPPQHAFANIFVVNFVALVISVFLGSALSLFILFYSMRDKARLADDVLSAMQAGDLKKRFPIKRLDEAGLMMQKFNKMADEIEHLVDKLKSTELARMRLLQELAHDLRTPVASLKNVLETLQLRIDVLKPTDREELLSLSVKEIEYFENLVEDLLFLAQVTDPRYHAVKSGTDLIELLDEELNGVEIRSRSGGGQVAVLRAFAVESYNFSGDVQLLRRLLRNAVENAFSFARKQVEVGVQILDEGRRVRILVRDDGPGLSREALAEFGEKRGTRAFTKTVTGRISVGLGSVIMKAVIQAHHGELAIENRLAPNGKILGAELRIDLRNES